MVLLNGSAEQYALGGSNDTVSVNPNLQQSAAAGAAQTGNIVYYQPLNYQQTNSRSITPPVQAPIRFDQAMPGIPAIPGLPQMPTVPAMDNGSSGGNSIMRDLLMGGHTGQSAPVPQGRSFNMSFPSYNAPLQSAQSPGVPKEMNDVIPLRYQNPTAGPMGNGMDYLDAGGVAQSRNDASAWRQPASPRPQPQMQRPIQAPPQVATPGSVGASGADIANYARMMRETGHETLGNLADYGITPGMMYQFDPRGTEPAWFRNMVAPKPNNKAYKIGDALQQMGRALNPNMAKAYAAEQKLKSDIMVKQLEQNHEDARKYSDNFTDLYKSAMDNDTKREIADLEGKRAGKMTQQQGWTLFGDAMKINPTTPELMQQQQQMLQSASSATGVDLMGHLGRQDPIAALDAKKKELENKKDILAIDESMWEKTQRGVKEAQNKATLESTKAGTKRTNQTISQSAQSFPLEQQQKRNNIAISGQEVKDLPSISATRQAGAASAISKAAIDSNPAVIASRAQEAANQGALSGQTLRNNDQKFAEGKEDIQRKQFENKTAPLNLLNRTAVAAQLAPDNVKQQMYGQAYRAQGQSGLIADINAAQSAGTLNAIGKDGKPTSPISSRVVGMPDDPNNVARGSLLHPGQPAPQMQVPQQMVAQRAGAPISDAEFNAQFGPPQKGMALDLDTAKLLLQKVGGDKQRAMQEAVRLGFSIPVLGRR